MIPQRNLSLLSNRLARKGGRRIPEAVLERDYCLSHGFVKPGELKEAVGQKMRFRGKDFVNTREILIKKEGRLKKLWNVRLLSQMTELPEFDQVHRYVSRELRQAGFLDDNNR